MTTMSVVEMDPLIESLYYWSDIIGVLLMGMIGGTMARQRGYDIVGFFFIAMFSSLTWLNLVRRLGQLFGEFADVSGQVGLCMEGMACDFDGKRPVFLQGSH